MYTPEPLPAKPYSIAQAIARMEGWYIAGEEANRPQRNNNPGDLDFAPWQVAHGATLEVNPYMRPRFACFPSAAQGWDCLRALLAGPLYCNLTVEDAINRYAPPSENDTMNYVDFVCELCECDKQTLVKELL